MTRCGMNTVWVGVMVIAVLLLSACMPQKTAREDGEPQALPVITWPAGQRFTIDPHRSELRVHLKAEGPLARFGHPHVIGTQTIRGQGVIAEPWPESVFQLNLAVDDFLVDPPLWRRQAGLEPDLATSAIDGTRANMRSSTQLDADAFPIITIQSQAISGSRHQPTLVMDVSVAGHLSQQMLPIALHWDERGLIASAQTTWRLSELGIEPFSALGGGLRVADEIEIRVRVYALWGNDQSMGE